MDKKFETEKVVELLRDFFEVALRVVHTQQQALGRERELIPRIF